eukprot:CAMPEP_0117565738 /NCGR_PEP_ID=MMETSP0784-20121206/56726_1 /TAXON_ID=39447 /ORGANISM="" /LENGTH=67 /DNA_ID=CAMNT_0005363547 /DNA_START=1 /DNA_END=204 /DNA_ORIENTATION=-
MPPMVPRSQFVLQAQIVGLELLDTLLLSSPGKVTASRANCMCARTSEERRHVPKRGWLCSIECHCAP